MHEDTDFCNWMNIPALFHYFQIPYPFTLTLELEHFVLQYVITVEFPVSGIFIKLYNFCFFGDVVEVFIEGTVKTIKATDFVSPREWPHQRVQMFLYFISFHFILNFLERVIVKLVSS